jgi:lysozyme
MNNMRMSDEGRRVLTRRFEGDVLKVYPDPATGGAPWTAGCGHTGHDVHPGMVVTPAMVDAWLMQDLAKAESAVNHLVTVPLTQHEFDALVDFVFNLGNVLSGSTLLRLLNAGQFHAAADQFLLWDHAAGKVMAGLLRRRQAEQSYFNTTDTGVA